VWSDERSEGRNTPLLGRGTDATSRRMLMCVNDTWPAELPIGGKRSPSLPYLRTKWKGTRLPCNRSACPDAHVRNFLRSDPGYKKAVRPAVRGSCCDYGRMLRWQRKRTLGGWVGVNKTGCVPDVSIAIIFRSCSVCGVLCLFFCVMCC